MHKPTGPGFSGGAAPPQFSVDHKKGEVNELRQLLKNVMVDKDKSKKKEVIKKVIAYMTLGIDVSKLYPDMVKVSSTTDMGEKKMIYLYLINYVEQNQDMAFMAINTFLKDCKDPTNPRIRGLALRSLCSLRFTDVISYLEGAITSALKDPDSYVRKTAVIGCTKLYHLAPAQFTNNEDYEKELYSLVKDSDPNVAINAILALEEILADKGGMEPKSELIIYLINILGKFNEWGQSIILDIAYRYTPKDEAEMYGIMNLLEDRFKHSSSSVVLATAKIFLKYTQNNPHLEKQVYQRLQAPLITLMTSGSTGGNYDLTYTVLSHIYLLVKRGAGEVFEQEYKHFFCKYDEPSYIKNLKLDILVFITSETNIQDVLNELSQYVTDVDGDLARKSIRCIGAICLKLPTVNKHILTELKMFLGLKVDYIITETFIILKDILRKYREFAIELVTYIENSMDMITEADGKAALIWVLAEFGEKIEDAPYMVEKIVESFKEFDSVKITLTLLIGACKLFFKRPPEMQKTLATLFSQVNKQCENVDVKEKALYYFKILKSDIETAEIIICSEFEKIDSFFEDEDHDRIEKLFAEFNTLAVVYQQPSEKFTKDIKIQKAKDLASTNKIETQNVASEEAATVNLLEIDSSDYNSKSDMKFDLIDSFNNSLSIIEEKQSVMPPLAPQLELDPDAEMDMFTFQNMWGSIHENTNLSKQLNVFGGVDVGNLEQKLTDINIFCMASGQMNEITKFFFYAVTMKKETILVEVMVHLTMNTLDAKIKSDNPALIPQFSALFESCFQ